MTFREYLLMREGYERKNKDQWERARIVAYCAGKPMQGKQPMSIYDFLPLPGDPTFEEQQAAIQKQKKKDEEYAMSVLENYKRKFSA